jgi:type VI secretion system protein ImpA
MTQAVTLGPLSPHWDKLLAPISAAHPSGAYLVYEGTYDAIREARRQEDPTLPMGDWQRPLKSADWPSVQQLCLEALENRSKDLQLGVWLLESLLNLHSFAGLHDGILLLHGLCAHFWDSLHPAVDDGDLDLRLSPLVWMNEKLSTQLTLLAITAPTDAESGVFNYAQLQKLLNNRNSQQAAAQQSKFQRSLTLTPTVFYQQLAQHLDSSLSVVKQLDALLDQHCAKAAPSLIRFRDALQGIAQAVARILKERLPNQTEAGAATLALDEAQTEGQNMQDEPINDGQHGPIRSRSEAYRRLAEAADYLLRTEPHSPTPYLVQRAVAWGSLPLHQLLQELVNDQSDLKAIYSLLGMHKREEEY